ncbi:helix-turn-helix domain-containing protein [Rhodopirellula sp.]|nr:helix-turn-helix domain-containing protein [Rhodopirellula sp.]
MQQVAKHAQISTSQLHRRFRDTYPMSSSKYLQRAILHNTSQDLIDTETQISVIALDNGFYDQAHMT